MVVAAQAAAWIRVYPSAVRVPVLPIVAICSTASPTGSEVFSAALRRPIDGDERRDPVAMAIPKTAQPNLTATMLRQVTMEALSVVATKQQSDRILRGALADARCRIVPSGGEALDVFVRAVVSRVRRDHGQNAAEQIGDFMQRIVSRNNVDKRKTSGVRRCERPRRRTTAHGVLVVDESLSARRALSRIVQAAGYKVMTATSGQKAAAMCMGWTPSLIVTELDMADLNGVDLATFVKQTLGADAPPIVLWTAATGDARIAAHSDMFRAVLPKPCPERKMLLAVQAALAIDE